MRVFATVVLAAVVNGGCQTPTLPTRLWQSPAVSPGDVPALPKPSALPATLEIRNASASARAFPGTASPYKFLYTVRFDVVETAGESAAWILGVQTTIADEFQDIVDEGCWGSPMRLGPGGTIRIDESLDYCAPYAASRGEIAGISIEVEYLDDENRRGQVRAVATVTQQR